jgi:NAD(P)-dependent dehydrogenase (short-subunit alcohol dehydrogenase family)
MTALEGKTALITGAGRGIGREIALRLARDGAFIIAHHGASREAAADVLSEIEAAGGSGFTIEVDLERVGVIAPMFATIDKELEKRGRSGLDILVNNAGITMPVNLAGLTEEMVDRVLAVNLKAPIFIAQQAAQRMREGGRIINISSMMGQFAYGGSAIAYGATKAAINYVTIAMAAELGPRGITVNAVAPGATATDFLGDFGKDPAMVELMASQTALGAMGDPRRVADAVALVASPDSGWITGERIRASGGMHL